MWRARLIAVTQTDFIFRAQDKQTILENRNALLAADQRRRPVFKDELNSPIVNWPRQTIYRGLRLPFAAIDEILHNGLKVNNSYFTRLPIIAGLNALLSSRNDLQEQDFCAVVIEVDTRHLSAEYTYARDPQDPNLIVTQDIPAQAISRVFVYSLYDRKFVTYIN